MTVAFRNVDVAASAAVRDWPTEAVLAVLERGDISDWARLGAVIRAEPWGRTARQVEECLTHSRPYGVAELMEDAIARARRGAEADERRCVSTELAELLARSGLRRVEFASRIGTSPSRLSTYLSGTVTPAATLLVRARRAADRAARWSDRPQQTHGAGLS